MKKIFAILFGSIALASCSSDDNSSSDDPVFSQPYTELTSLEELKTGRYTYVGNKIGDRKVGLITESTACKKDDYLIVHRNGAVLDSITYNNYRRDIVDNKEQCLSIFEFPRLMHSNVLVSNGMLKTIIEDGFLQEVVTAPIDEEEVRVGIREDGGETEGEEKVEYEYKRKSHYSGELEIGFQAGYLRIEDRLSDYTRVKGEKVYLYFKKN